MKFEDLYCKDTFANEAGVVLDEVNDDFAKMSVKVEKRHLNGGNVAHGALLFLLSDMAMAAMANHKQPISVSIQSDIRFLTAAFEGDVLTATAVEVFARKKLYNSRVTISNQDGVLIAIAEGMFHVKRI